MFKKGEWGSSFKLIDFGAGTFSATSIEAATNKRGKRIQYDLSHPVPPDFDEEEGINQFKPTKIRTSRGDQLHLHTTFAESAFYISPEMFHHHYTLQTGQYQCCLL